MPLRNDNLMIIEDAFVSYKNIKIKVNGKWEFLSPSNLVKK